MFFFLSALRLISECSVSPGRPSRFISPHFLSCLENELVRVSFTNGCLCFVKDSSGQSINIFVYLLAISIRRLTLDVISSIIYLSYNVVAGTKTLASSFERQERALSMCNWWERNAILGNLTKRKGAWLCAKWNIKYLKLQIHQRKIKYVHGEIWSFHMEIFKFPTFPLLPCTSCRNIRSNRSRRSLDEYVLFNYI